jgi:hypothetical protein
MKTSTDLKLSATIWTEGGAEGQHCSSHHRRNHYILRKKRLDLREEEGGSTVVGVYRRRVSDGFGFCRKRKLGRQI